MRKSLRHLKQHKMLVANYEYIFFPTNAHFMNPATIKPTLPIYHTANDKAK